MFLVKLRNCHIVVPSLFRTFNFPNYNFVLQKATRLFGEQLMNGCVCLQQNDAT